MHIAGNKDNKKRDEDVTSHPWHKTDVQVTTKTFKEGCVYIARLQHKLTRVPSQYQLVCFDFRPISFAPFLLCANCKRKIKFVSIITHILPSPCRQKKISRRPLCLDQILCREYWKYIRWNINIVKVAEKMQF